MTCIRAILALYTLVWLNVVVPGHTRGLLTMPGANDPAKSSGSCCASASGSKHQSKPTPDEQRRCAVCYVAANYTVPVVYVFDLTPAERVAISNVAAHAQVHSIEFPTPFWPVGPPGLL